MSPDELAGELGVSGKTIRAWLRQTYPRPEEMKHKEWAPLSRVQVDAARERFRVRWRRADSRRGMIVTTLALSAPDHRQLSAAAEERRVSMAELIRELVAQWLRRNRRPRERGNP